MRLHMYVYTRIFIFSYMYRQEYITTLWKNSCNYNFIKKQITRHWSKYFLITLHANTQILVHNFRKVYRLLPYCLQIHECAISLLNEFSAFAENSWRKFICHHFFFLLKHYYSLTKVLSTRMNFDFVQHNRTTTIIRQFMSLLLLLVIVPTTNSIYY